jgi:hypothetical protein
MMKQISFQISDQLAEKFEIALKLTGEDRNQVAEDFIRRYLGKAFSDAADSLLHGSQNDIRNLKSASSCEITEEAKPDCKGT